MWTFLHLFVRYLLRISFSLPLNVVMSLSGQSKPERRSGAPEFISLAFRGPKQVKLNWEDARSRVPKHVQDPPYHLTMCFLQLYCSFHIVCSEHMSQCVAFDYFSIDCEKQSVLKVTPPGAVV